MEVRKKENWKHNPANMQVECEFQQDVDLVGKQNEVVEQQGKERDEKKKKQRQVKVEQVGKSHGQEQVKQEEEKEQVKKMVQMYLF